MSIDAETACFLTGEAGRRLLNEVASLQGDVTARVLNLRKRGLTPAQASGIVEVAETRTMPRFRFPESKRLFFTASALAQATSPIIADYHASRLAPLGTVADLGCGVGMDAIALARAGASVVAIDRDPTRLIFARANAEAYGVGDAIQFVEGDVTELNWQANAVFWDPSRREGNGEQGVPSRVSRHADRYEPPLSFAATLCDRVRGGAIKLSPALPDDVLQDLGGQVTFLSEGRECKEACVWFGEAARDDEPRWSATLLPEGLVFAHADPNIRTAAGPGEYVFDPDPALIRADALGALTDAIDVEQLTGEDHYLTGSVLPREVMSRAVSAYRVIEAMPYKPRALADWLRARGIGRLVVKKRFFPLEPDALAKMLGLSGKGNELTIILSRRSRHEFLAVFCEPILQLSQP